MGSRKEKNKEIDPEVLMKRKFRAKCLFRALGRMVMENTYWMIEDVESYEGVDDVKRRVEQAVRSKVKKKQLLKIQDKALLNKPAADRTDQEKKYLYRIIGGLKCFKRYPNHVKRKLAAVTYFKYYGPNRIIVRQHQEAHALYFIVSGDISVSQTVFDGLIQEYISVEIGSLHTGDMFGEVSLLHNIPRTATCTTVGHCEFLQLLREDFKHVLLSSVQKQWDEVRKAMSKFTYFDALDEVATREGCIVAKLKSFEINETVLGDGCGIQNHVYFVLTGRIQMVESLQIVVTKRLGQFYFTLYDPWVPPEESEEDFDKKWFSNYPDLNKTNQSLDQARVSASGVLPQRTTLSGTTNNHARSIGSILKLESDHAQTEENEPKVVVSETKHSKVEHKRTSFSKSGDTVMSQKMLTVPEGKPEEETRKPSNTSIIGSKVIMLPIEGEARASVRYSVAPAPEAVLKHQGNLKTYFMQVCIMNPGSTFGFGENMRDRRMVALTPVTCMLMPKIWLLQRNTANIWTRIQYYLEKKIPTKECLFEEFVKQRRWEQYREQCVEDVVARTHSVNYTTLHDVPYSIRMAEMFDI